MESVLERLYVDLRRVSIELSTHTQSGKNRVLETYPMVRTQWSEQIHWKRESLKSAVSWKRRRARAATATRRARTPRRCACWTGTGRAEEPLSATGGDFSNSKVYSWKKSGCRLVSLQSDDRARVLEKATSAYSLERSIVPSTWLYWKRTGDISSSRSTNRSLSVGGTGQAACPRASASVRDIRVRIPFQFESG